MDDASSKKIESGTADSQGASSPKAMGDRPSLSAANGLDYRVRVSKRAKNISIHVSHWGEVEIVIPPSFDPRQVPAIVERRQAWILRTRQRFLDRQETMPLDVVQPLPEEIQLRSLPETWTVTYAPAPATQLTATTRRGCQLHIHGPTENLESCQALLRRWLNRKATDHFLPWLRQVSREIDLPYTSASVRQQKTRWASCSSKRTIKVKIKVKPCKTVWSTKLRITPILGNPALRTPAKFADGADRAAAPARLVLNSDHPAEYPPG